MIRLATVYGTCDTYLPCALLRSFMAQFGPAVIVCKSNHVAIPQMFGLPYVIDDEAAQRGEDPAFQASYPNNFPPHGDDLFYVHPHFNHRRNLCFELKSHADAWRVIMRVTEPPPSLERMPVPETNRYEHSVLLLPEARSIANTQPTFWHQLAHALREARWQVIWTDKSWSLERLFMECAKVEWVVGPQCGVMTILNHAQFPCRKSFCTPSFPNMWPNCYVTTFAGEDYDVDEFEITDGNHQQVIDCLLASPNAVHRTLPMVTVQTPLALGDFLDRLAVLEAKMQNFSPDKQASIRREYDRYWRIYRQNPVCGDLLTSLTAVHTETFLLCAHYVPDALAGVHDEAAHAKAIALNKRRVELKQEIDRQCNSAYSEVKSYYS